MAVFNSIFIRLSVDQSGPWMLAMAEKGTNVFFQSSLTIRPSVAMITTLRGNKTRTTTIPKRAVNSVNSINDVVFNLPNVYEKGMRRFTQPKTVHAIRYGRITYGKNFQRYVKRDDIVRSESFTYVSTRTTTVILYYDRQLSRIVTGTSPTRRILGNSVEGLAVAGDLA